MKTNLNRTKQTNMGERTKRKAQETYMNAQTHTFEHTEIP